MQKPKMYFLAASLDWKQCSLARETLKQATLFAEKGFETTLISFDFDAFYPFLRSQLYQDGGLHKAVTIRNMHEDLAGYVGQALVKKEMPVFDIEVLQKQGYLEKQSATEYKMLDKKIILSETGTLAQIYYTDTDNNRIFLEDYNPWGDRKRKSLMDAETKKVRQEIYYNVNGKAYLSIWYDSSTGAFDKAHRLTNKGMISQEYSEQVAALQADWLERLLDKEERAVVVSNGFETDKILHKAKATTAAKILHLLSHDLKGYGEETMVKRITKEGFSAFDGVILSSETEKQRLSKRFGNQEKMHVIPYCPKQKNGGFRFWNRIRKDKRLAVAINLFDDQALKQIMQAFQEVQAAYPDTILHVYGRKSDKSIFSALQNLLKLEENTSFYLFGQADQNICEPALFSIVAAADDRVSFPIIESMSYCTPVIQCLPSFQADSLLEDGETGFSVEMGDTLNLASKIAYFFHHPAKALTMGEKAKRFIEKHFNQDIYTDKWHTFLENVLSQK